MVNGGASLRPEWSEIYRIKEIIMKKILIVLILKLN